MTAVDGSAGATMPHCMVPVLLEYLMHRARCARNKPLPVIEVYLCDIGVLLAAHIAGTISG